MSLCALALVLMYKYRPIILKKFIPLSNILAIGSCFWVVVYSAISFEYNSNFLESRELAFTNTVLTLLRTGKQIAPSSDQFSGHAAIWIAYVPFVIFALWKYKDGTKAIMALLGVLSVHEIEWYVNYAVMNPQNIYVIIENSIIFVIVLLIELMSVAIVYKDLAKVMKYSALPMAAYYLFWDVYDHFAVTLDLKTGITIFYHSISVNLLEIGSWYYALILFAILMIYLTKTIPFKKFMTKEQAKIIIDDKS